jgi:hypothetical protein
MKRLAQMVKVWARAALRVRFRRTMAAAACALALLLPGPGLRAQRNRDPLNNAEIDELRDTNQEPEKRLKLIVKFAAARLDSIDQLLADAQVPPADKPEKIHDLLQDFLSIYDELGDNLDMYTDQKADLRKALRDVIQGDSEFRVRLRRMKDAARDPAAEKEYGFALDNAIDAVNAGSDEHHKLAAEQKPDSRRKK